MGHSERAGVAVTLYTHILEIRGSDIFSRFHAVTLRKFLNNIFITLRTFRQLFLPIHHLSNILQFDCCIHQSNISTQWQSNPENKVKENYEVQFYLISSVLL
jgi:hypothetical protein